MLLLTLFTRFVKFVILLALSAFINITKRAVRVFGLTFDAILFLKIVTIMTLIAK